MYSLDTSFFMDWQARYYPLDLFVGLEQRIDQMVATGAGRAVDLVREELEAVGTPDLVSWAKRHKALFVALTSEVQIEAAGIQATYPELMDLKGIHDSADAYVIALGKIEKRIVVSQETSVNEKHRPERTYYIPMCVATSVSPVSISWA